MLDELITHRYAQWLEAERAKEAARELAEQERIQQLKDECKARVCQEFSPEVRLALRSAKTGVGYTSQSGSAYVEVAYQGYRVHIQQGYDRFGNKAGWKLEAFLADSYMEVTPLPFPICKEGELELALLANLGYVLDPDR